MIRLFVGLPIPDAHRAALADIGGGLSGARWVAPDNFHITLRFIGELTEPDAEAVAQSLDDLAFPAFPVTIKGLSFGGDAHRARTLWAEVERTPEILDLQRRVESLVSAPGVAPPPESRKFRPHVTLARFSGVRPDKLQEFLSHHALIAPPPFTADRVVLYSSVLNRQGSQYTEEVSYPLGDPT